MRKTLLFLTLLTVFVIACENPNDPGRTRFDSSVLKQDTSKVIVDSTVVTPPHGNNHAGNQLK